MKNCLSRVVGAVMMLSMSAMVFAADTIYENTTVDVTVNGNSHADFFAIQIFKGTQVSTDDDQPLGDIEWADDVKAQSAKVISAVNPAGISVAETATAKEVAEAIANANLTATTAEPLAKALYDEIGTITGTKLTSGQTNEVPVGWYLVVDRSELGKNDASNAAVLQFTKNITISKKTDAPEQEKKVKEDSTYDQKNGYNDVADYDIGEAVPFQITSKIPSIDSYAKYEMTFTDTMSEGLTLNEDSLTVTIGSKTYTNAEVRSNSNIVFTKTSNGFTLELIVKKAAANGLSGTYTDIYAEGASIALDFTATLNEKAKVGLPGNTNTSKLTYTNSPDADDTHDSTKDTPEDTVIVFTYELDVTKVNKDKEKLEGAEFVLMKDDKYYNVNTTTKAVTWVDDQKDATVFTSPAGGQFAIVGIDEGTYKLVETKAPTGYNKLTDPITVVIAGEYIADRQKWEDGVAANALKATTLKVDDGDAKESATVGVLATDVENNKGAVLPSTGGMGTTMIYIIGAILLLGAGVLLVTRRRMAK